MNFVLLTAEKLTARQALFTGGRMLIVGMDFETTWTEPVDPRLARVTEVGAVLWDTESNHPISVFSSFVYGPDYPEIPQEGVDLNGISTDLLQRYGEDPGVVFRRLQNYFLQGEYVVAHNGTNFDKIIYDCELERFQIPSVEHKWIDTRIDVPYPKNITSRKLLHLAAEHGFANPFPHRAIFDVMTMLKVLSMYDVGEVVRLSQEPNVTVVARVSFQDKDLAKKRNYQWNGEDKSWTKTLKQSQVQKEVDEAPFVTLVRGD